MTAKAIIEAHENKLLDRYLEAQECLCEERGCCLGLPDECWGECVPPELDYEDSDTARWKDQDRAL